MLVEQDRLHHPWVGVDVNSAPHIPTSNPGGASFTIPELPADISWRAKYESWPESQSVFLVTDMSSMLLFNSYDSLSQYNKGIITKIRTKPHD